MNNQPGGRKKNVTGEAKKVRRYGEGLGTGPVGRPEGYESRRKQQVHALFSTGKTQTTSDGNVTRAAPGGGLIAVIIGIIVLLIGGGGAGLSSLFGGSGGGGGSSILSTLLGGAPSFASEEASQGWTEKSNDKQLNETVAGGARAKRTEILGGGKDKVTVMVYICGADLESRSGMASQDIAEMKAAKLSKNVNLVICTGGSTRWKDTQISSSVNQVFEIKDGKLVALERDFGKDAMTKPATLSKFIKYVDSHYDANRNVLILWDHGGGSISGYGYDEKNASAGTMTLSGIKKAISDSNMKFDFIGFDTCLMATYENAIMLSDYADYLVASEETEPGIGWYYTNWLTKLASDTSMPTVEIGKNIADDFVSECGRMCPGQKATLSVVDLAELSKTTPSTFKSFAANAAELCKSDDYQKVSDARAGSRSFAVSSKKDMVDLAHLGYLIGTTESRNMSDSIVNAVKYNRVSSNMANSYGLSIYFPYQKVSGVSSAVQAYEDIGVDESYAECIRSFATLEITGQEAGGGGSSSPLSALFGGSTGQAPMSSGGISDLFGSLLGGGGSSIDGLSGLSSFFGRDISADQTVPYVASNQLDSTELVWKESDEGNVISITEEQWDLVQKLELNVFIDDGKGYIDLGLDNYYEFCKYGIKDSYDGSWLAIGDQAVAYYYEKTDGNTVSGRIPVLLNGERAELIVVFEDGNEGKVVGARRIYVENETDAVSKSEAELNVGDEIIPIADYYTYDEEYIDSYKIAETPIVYDGTALTVTDRILADDYVATYLFTDIYGQEHWSEKLPD